MTVCALCSCLTSPYFLAAVGIAVAFKLWFKFTTGICKSERRLDGKTVIVTGANTGIGKETARDLAARGARVILACRDLQRGQEAREDIISSTGNKRVELYHLDFTSLESVRQFADKILSSEKRLDVLVNNAGAVGLANKKTIDGLQILMQVNHFGPFLLTNLLLELLKKSSPSRIIMVSSLAHRYASLSMDNLNCEKSYKRATLYNDTKLANVLTSNELARRLKGTGVTVNSLHPGAVKTDLLRNLPTPFRQILEFISKLTFKSAVEGAQTSIYLAVSEDVEGVTGKYFEDCKEVRPLQAALDQGLARKLWEKSEQLVKL